jgi:hypothetical protein
MLNKDQVDREADRRWAAAQEATHWRHCAQKMREKASHMGAEDRIQSALSIAALYEFIAELEERTRRYGL